MHSYIVFRSDLAFVISKFCFCFVFLAHRLLHSEEDIQLARLMDRSGLSEADAKKRIAAQMPLEKKCAQSHFIVENSSTQLDTAEQTLKILEVLLESNHHWRIRGIILATAAVFLSGVAWLLNYKYKIFSSTE